jgi:hypothetical protein
MNHTAIDYTAKIAAGHRADVAAAVSAARTARRVRHPGEANVPVEPLGHRGGWWGWMRSPRTVH